MKDKYQFGDYEPYEPRGKFLLVRLVACILVGFACAFLIIQLLMPVWNFLDEHQLWTGLTVLALAGIWGIVWLIKWVRR